jgi:hypothetical protein
LTAPTAGINPALAAQINQLRAQASPASVPGGLLAWWGRTDFPDGSSPAPALTQRQWEGAYVLLQRAALAPGILPPLYAVQGLTSAFRPDGPLPIAVASLRLAACRPAFRDAVLAAATKGSALTPPLPSLGDCIQPARAFLAAGLLHDQWGLDQPVFRSRVVTYLLDERFFITTPGDPLPDLIELDPADGSGARPIAFGESRVAAYPRGATPVATLRCRYGASVLEARFTVPLGDQPAAPAPDQTWSLYGPPFNTGKAYVYLGAGHDALTNPLIVSEGFPGGYPYDYSYDLLNQHGTLEALRTSGYDVILLSYDNGLDLIQNNAQVAVACIQQALAATKAPLVVGGVSMGGLVTRYALAFMESHGMPHRTRIYFSVDTPHRGAYTSIGDQWFAHYYAPALAEAAAFAMLLDSPSNQQFVMRWLHGDSTQASPLHEGLLEQLRYLGNYPQQPRRLAIACGAGDGVRDLAPHQPLLSWNGSPFVGLQLWSLPEGEEPDVIAKGYCFVTDPSAAGTLTGASRYSWEGAPGGRNVYNRDAAMMAAGLGCGAVSDPVGRSCSVPTVSALDLDLSPFVPVPPPASGASPFHDYTCSPSNVPHLMLTPETSAWLLAKLGAPPTTTA